MCNQRLPPRHVPRVHGAFTDTCTCQQGADFTKGWKLASRCRSSRSKFHRSKVSTRTIRRAFCLLTWDDAGSELAIVSKPVPHLCCGLTAVRSALIRQSRRLPSRCADPHARQGKFVVTHQKAFQESRSIPTHSRDDPEPLLACGAPLILASRVPESVQGLSR
jgi:hypothetical protein